MHHLRRPVRDPNARKRWASLCVSAALALGLGPAATAAQEPPVAPVRPVVTDYFGTRVVDNYRYMENLQDPAVQAWMKAQAGYTRSTLDAIPGRKALEDRIHALSNSRLARGRIVRRGERLFYLEYQPGAALPKLFYRDGLRGEGHMLVDPAALNQDSKTHVALDYFQPSWDGQLLAYGVSAGGSEASVLHVMEVSTGKVLAEAIDRTGGAQVAWRADNRSFFYMRYAKPTPGMPAAERMYNARAYGHVVGERADGEGDGVVFGRGVASNLEVPEGQGAYVVTSPDSPYAIAVANHNMDSNPATLYVAAVSAIDGARTPWRKIADVGDGVKDIHLRADTLYFISQKDAPNFRLLAMPLARPDVHAATVVIEQSAAVLTGVSLSKEGIYARLRDGAVSHLNLVSFDGRPSRRVTLPVEGNIDLPITDPFGSGALIGARGWTRASTLLAYDAASDTASDSGLQPPSPIDTSQFESREATAVSYDGTLIPLSLTYKKGLQLDGSHPTMLVGYGSYGRSLEPGFDTTYVAWYEQGGVLAIAHLRGGGEHGEAWHQAGQKLTKPNTILDFIACAHYLIDERYTVPSRLAALGGSAGGIPVGGALTWRPDLFGVILDQVGVSDTLRFETEPNGPPNVSEFGSIQTEEGFHGLYAMSAYAHVRDGTKYPAVMFTTGANDPRVAPWHMTKMAARVQAATSSQRPVLLRIDFDAGHGLGSSASQNESKLADLMSFSLWQMGVAGFQP